MVEIVETYGKWLAESSPPKLFINADPGAILVGSAVAEFISSIS